jgi:hypothetical protein
MMPRYEADIIAWANEQAAFIRAGQFDRLDLEHLADEIEDVGKSEQREFESRMAVLLAHLIKWQYQPSHRGRSWERTIRDQRTMISRRLIRTPSLEPQLLNPDFWAESWADALLMAEKESGILDVFPESCPWSAGQIMSHGFWPERDIP